MSKNDFGCQRHDRNTGYLADVRYRTAGTGVYLDDIDILANCDELNVNQSDNMQGTCQTFGVLLNGIFYFLADALCRIYGNTVSGMDTSTLNVLHDTRNQDILTVAYCVDLDLFTLQVFINQNRMILCNPVDDTDEFFYVLIIDGNLHTLSAKYIGRTNQYRISQSVCYFFCFLCRVYGASLRSRDLALFQNLVEELSVLSCIHIFCGSSKDRHTHLHKSLCQFDGSLSTELYHSSIRFFQANHALHIFRSQRLKIQFICNIEVRTYGLRVVVNDNGLITLFGKCPGTMYRTEVKLDTLTDTDRTRAKYQHLLTIVGLNGFVFASIYRIVIWRRCFELCCTGIYHLECCYDTIVVTHLLDLFLGFSGQICDHVIRELDSLCFS